MKQFSIGDKVKIADKTHIGAIPYQGKRGKVVKIFSKPPQGYIVRLKGESKTRFFLDWEVLKEAK